MTARHYCMSITDQNFEEFSAELNQMMEIMKHAKFGEDGRWKPFQRGFIVSTTSILEMTKFLLTSQVKRLVSLNLANISTSTQEWNI